MSIIHYSCSGCGREVAYQYWDIFLDEPRSDFRSEECYGGKKVTSIIVKTALKEKQSLV